MIKKYRYFFYIFFAILSTLINLGVQYITEYLLYISNIDFFRIILFKNISFNFFIKMFIATIIAFIFKFIVDKLIIFSNKSNDINENIRQILFYGFFAIFTTLIFWTTEFIFKYLFVEKIFEYAGAVLGLAIGYSIKFLLDRKFVFKKVER